MGIRDILAGGVKIASKIVDDVKVSVSYEAWIGDDGKGSDAFAAAVPIRCIVSRKARTIRTQGGQFATAVATLTLLDAVASTTPNAGKTRLQPVDPRDVFTLPDGTTAPIVDIGGPMDPKTGDTFIKTITLGNVPRGQ